MSAPVAGLPPRPQPGTPRPYHFPAVHRTALPNGMKVLVVPMPRLPIVTAMTYVDAGATADPTGAEGLAVLTAASLTEGIAGYEGVRLIERFEQLGTVASVWADWEGSYARLTVLKAQLAPALGMLAEVLRAPTFPAREVERLRDIRLADLVQQLAEPRGLADERFDAFLYAPSVRYARSVGGTPKTVGGSPASRSRRSTIGTMDRRRRRSSWWGISPSRRGWSWRPPPSAIGAMRRCAGRRRSTPPLRVAGRSCSWRSRRRRSRSCEWGIWGCRGSIPIISRSS